jgi:hypothetical protein
MTKKQCYKNHTLCKRVAWTLMKIDPVQAKSPDSKSRTPTPSFKAKRVQYRTRTQSIAIAFKSTQKQVGEGRSITP